MYRNSVFHFMPACRNPHAATCCQEFHATDATKILRNERHGSLRCERCAFVAGAARNNSAPHEKVSRYERHENITLRALRVLTLRALRFRCERRIYVIIRQYNEQLAVFFVL